MGRITLRWAMTAIAVVLVSGLVLTSARGDVQLAQAANAQAVSVEEGRDFATLVLHDPWDMSQFSDISQFLNNSNQSSLISNYQVQNGIFSATSISTDPWFAVLFQGYGGAMLIGKVGARYPIDQNTYKCLYFAANISSGAEGQIYWFKDEGYTSSPFGLTNFTVVPSAWNLYRVDLTTGPEIAWSTYPWHGLRIDPTTANGATFAFDWVRLTDCGPRNLSLGGLAAATTYSFYITGSSGQQVRLPDFTTDSGGNGIEDLEGVAADSYTYVVKSGAIQVQTGSFSVVTTPVVNFVRPSFISGTDYASRSGNPWDFADAGDTSQVPGFPGVLNLKSYSFANGNLSLVTASGPAPGQDVDPMINLNSPDYISGSANPYRYLTFRMYTGDPIQNDPQGMIARWIYQRPGSGGLCYLVSHDIPYDVGWQTYTVDLYDSYNGTAVQAAGNCAGVSVSWQTNTQQILRMRFDPNENVLGHDLAQQLDWIRLTRVDEVKAGNTFPIQISLNVSASQVPTRDFFYTDNPANPIQHPAAAYSPPPPSGAFQIYVPLIAQNYAAALDTLPPADVTYFWDTSGVAPGSYYTCVHVQDAAGTNSAYSYYCSEAPVTVTP